MLYVLCSQLLTRYQRSFAICRTKKHGEMASSWSVNEGPLRRFARLIPGSKAAEEVLNILCDNPEVTEYHRSFLQAKRMQKNVEESSDSEEPSKTPSQQIEIWSGYYSLTLNDT